jgi:hypothetical protein
MDTLIQLLPLLVCTILSGIPAFRLLGRTGQSKGWVIFVVLFPFIGLIVFIWVEAYSRWIRQPQRCACHGERRRRTGHSTWARPTGFAVDSPLEERGFEIVVPL